MKINLETEQSLEVTNDTFGTIKLSINTEGEFIVTPVSVPTDTSTTIVNPIINSSYVTGMIGNPGQPGYNPIINDVGVLPITDVSPVVKVVESAPLTVNTSVATDVVVSNTLDGVLQLSNNEMLPFNLKPPDLIAEAKAREETMRLIREAESQAIFVKIDDSNSLE